MLYLLSGASMTSGPQWGLQLLKEGVAEKPKIEFYHTYY